MASAPPPASRFYVPQLDGLRFIAFLMVFLSHAPRFATTGVVAFVQRVFKFGWLGVDAFFLLSAYLITKILLIEYRRDGSIRWLSFYARRALRIWPLYYLALLMGFVVVPWMGYNYYHFEPGSLEAQHLAMQRMPYVLFLGNFASAQWGFLEMLFSPVWSVSVEEQFYLVWPLALLFMLRRRRLLVCVPVALFGVTIAFQLHVIAAHLPYPAIWVHTLARLDPFILGGTLAFVGDRIRSSRAQLWGGVGLLVLIVALGLDPGSGSASVVLLYLLSAVAFLLLVQYAASSRGRVASFLSAKPMTWLGKISYGLYVWHFVAYTIVGEGLLGKHDWGDNARSFTSWCVHMTLALVLDIGLSALSYYLFEAQFLKLKRRFEVVVSRAV